jgi:F-type H+-transporting ATPase subunit b
MISINATLVIQVIHFLILTYVLNRLMLQPLLKLIRERQTYVENTRRGIEDMELETERLRQEYVSREAGARREASDERIRIRSEGTAESEGFTDKSRQKVVSMRAEADRQAEKEIEKSQPLLHDEAAGLAQEITKKILGRRIGD